MGFAQAMIGVYTTMYRVTGGRLGGRGPGGSNVLLLTTVGRRTGKRRTRPVGYVRDGERYVVCASNAGKARHPAWYLNASASGRADVQVGAERFGASAATADPDERARLFPRFVEMYKGYGGYEHKAGREIPLLVLTPDRP